MPQKYDFVSFRVTIHQDKFLSENKIINSDFVQNFTGDPDRAELFHIPTYTCNKKLSPTFLWV